LNTLLWQRTTSRVAAVVLQQLITSRPAAGAALLLLAFLRAGCLATSAELFLLQEQQDLAIFFLKCSYIYVLDNYNSKQLRNVKNSQ
jgi:hypothetical protein